MTLTPVTFYFDLIVLARRLHGIFDEFGTSITRDHWVGLVKMHLDKLILISKGNLLLDTIKGVYENEMLDTLAEIGCLKRNGNRISLAKPPLEDIFDPFFILFVKEMIFRNQSLVQNEFVVKYYDSARLFFLTLHDLETLMQMAEQEHLIELTTSQISEERTSYIDKNFPFTVILPRYHVQLNLPQIEQKYMLGYEIDFQKIDPTYRIEFVLDKWEKIK